MSGELKAGEAIPSVRSLAKSLHISILTVQKAYATLQEDGFIETTAGKGCYVSAQNQDFYLEEQQKKIEEKFAEAIEIARTSGILRLGLPTVHPCEGVPCPRHSFFLPLITPLSSYFLTYYPPRRMRFSAYRLLRGCRCPA